MFDIILDNMGFLKSYKRISTKEEAAGEIWYAYEEIAEVRNGKCYVDTLNSNVSVNLLNSLMKPIKKGWQ